MALKVILNEYSKISNTDIDISSLFSKIFDLIILTLSNKERRDLHSEEFPEDLEKASIEECVLAWADYTETDLEDNFESVCEKIVELGIC